MIEQLPVVWSKEKQKFCYLYVDYVYQAYAGFGLIIFTLLLMGKTFIQFMQTRAQDKLNFNIKIIYLSILALEIFYILKIGLSQIAFWKSYHTPQQQVSQFNSIISKYIFSTEFLEFFNFQTMLLMVSYNWIDNTIQILQYMLGNDNTSVHITRETRVLKIIKICLIVRIIQLFILVPFAYFQTNAILALFVKIVTFLWLFQQLFLTIIFVLTTYLIYNNKKLKQLLDEKESKKMMIKYGVLAVLMMARFCWSVIYTFIMLENDYVFISGSCYLEQNQDQVLQSVFFIIKGLVIFVIIWIVLKIFNINGIQDRSSSLSSYYKMTTEINLQHIIE